MTLLSEECKQRLLEQLSSIEYEPVVCHGDYHPYNVLLDREQLTIIDWIDATSGDYRADVYRSYLLISASSLELAEQYIELYCNQSGTSFQSIMQWAQIIAAARLSEHLPEEEIKRLLQIFS